MNNHALTPWQVFPPNKPTEIKTKYGRPGMDESELIPITALGEGVSKASNAEFIVQACNAYDEMLRTLRDALGIFQLLGSGQKPPFSCSEMCERIGTTIANAEERKR